MAKAAKPSIKPEEQYRITLNRAVTLPNGTILRPRDHDVVVKGKVLSSIGDAVESFEQIED